MHLCIKGCQFLRRMHLVYSCDPANSAPQGSKWSSSTSCSSSVDAAAGDKWLEVIGDGGALLYQLEVTAGDHSVACPLPSPESRQWGFGILHSWEGALVKIECALFCSMIKCPRQGEGRGQYRRGGRKRGNVCPARARRATFLLTIPTSAPDLPSHGEAPQVDHIALHTFPTKHVAK